MIWGERPPEEEAGMKNLEQAPAWRNNQPPGITCSHELTNFLLFLSSFLIYLFIHLFIFLSFYHSIYYLSIYLDLYLSIYLSIYIYIYLSIHISIYIAINLSIYLSINFITLVLFSIILYIQSFFDFIKSYIQINVLHLPLFFISFFHQVTSD